jgi:hypothetical protein
MITAASGIVALGASMTETEKDPGFCPTRADAERLCDAWNSGRNADSELWVPRQTAPGEWRPVLARLPRARGPKTDEFAISTPAGPRRLPSAPPIEPLRDGERRLGLGRALDYIGYAIFGLLALSPLLALIWVSVRIWGGSSNGVVRLLGGIVSAVALVAGWILFRVTEGSLRSIRNAWKPPALTWRQFELSQRFLHSAAIAIIVVGAAGIGLAIPTRL